MPSSGYNDGGFPREYKKLYIIGKPKRNRFKNKSSKKARKKNR